jgi:phosphopantothenoylcysteine decarboxylase/phosphopantothenate--cysteine ligase
VKVKKTGSAGEGDAGPTIELTTNPDVLAGLAAQPRLRPGQVVVGFAAETGDAHGSVLDHGRAKLARKGCDLLIVNEVGDTRGFGTPDNEVTILGADGSQTVVPSAGKDVVAHRIWDAAVPLLPVSQP